jgi:hypothetical protein
MGSERSKWISYHKLCEALNAPGCAICRLIVEISQRMLSSLFHECVNDPSTRAWLQASSGFCNLHAWMAARMRDTESGLGIIYETILDVAIKRFGLCQRALSARGSKGGAIGKLLRRNKCKVPQLLVGEGQCQICSHAAEFEEFYLHELITWFDDEQLRAAFDRSFGLCLPHMDLLVARHRDHENLPALIEAEGRRCQVLRAELSEFIRKLDYQYAGEAPGSEQDAWRRAVEFCAGKPQLFGSHMRRSK